MNNALLIRTMGLLAFAHILDLSEPSYVHDLIGGMGITYEDFMSSVEVLERKELVEIRYDCVKVADQNVASFYFYLAFVKYKYLSFMNLLVRHADKQMHRIVDSVIPVHNSYGHESVMKQLQPQIKDFYYSCDNEALKEVVADKFWYYLKDEVFNIIAQKTCTLPKVSADAVSDDTRPQVKNSYCYVITQIARLLHTDRYADVMPLGMEFIRRSPGLYGEFLGMLEEEMALHKNDFSIGFVRQKEFLKVVFWGVEDDDPLSLRLFGFIVPFLLRRSFIYTENSMDGVSIITLTVPADCSYDSFRTSLWESLDRYWAKVGSLDLLRECHASSLHMAECVSGYDFDMMELLIGKYMDPDDFLHCRFVHEASAWYRKKIHRDFGILSRFTNDRIRLYYSFRKNGSLTPGMVNGIEDFYDAVKFFYDMEDEGKRYGYDDDLGKVLESLLKADDGLGLCLLEKIRDDNFTRYSPFCLFKEYSSDKLMIQKFWDVISVDSYDDYNWWVSMFFRTLSQDFCTEEHVSVLYRLTSEGTFHLFPMPMLLMEYDGEIVYGRVMRNIHDNIASGGRALVRDTVLVDYAGADFCDHDLLCAMYFQQLGLDKHYDYDFKVALLLIQRDIHMLSRLVREIDDWSGYSSLHRLHEVWDLDGIYEVMNDVMDYYSTDFQLMDMNKCNVFFRYGKGEREKDFLLQYVAARHFCVDSMNLVMDIVENSRKDLCEDVVREWLRCTENLELFKEIKWIWLKGVFYGNVNFATMRIRRWQRILDVVESMPDSYRYYELSRYIHNELHHLKKSEESEDRHNYLWR